MVTLHIEGPVLDQWRLFWVGDGGSPQAAELSGWQDLAARERAAGFRDRQPILLSPLGPKHRLINPGCRHRVAGRQ
jgi:hypothetical protein